MGMFGLCWLCLCRCQVYVDVRFMWMSGLCGCQVYVDVRFMCMSGLCGCQVYVDVRCHEMNSFTIQFVCLYKRSDRTRQ